VPGVLDIGGDDILRGVTEPVVDAIRRGVEELRVDIVKVVDGTNNMIRSQRGMSPVVTTTRSRDLHRALS
jgi:hypothetical protein